MSSTYLALCDKLRNEVGVPGTISSVTGQTGMFAKLITWIADADIDINNEWSDWGFLHASFSDETILATKDITAPTDLGLWDKDSFYLDYSSATYQKLKYLDYFIWRDSYRNGVKTNDKPDFIIIKPDLDLILEPPPNDVYTITADYYKTATRMSDNSDVSLIPTRYDRIIIARAKIYYAEHEDASEVMQGAVNEYNDLMKKLQSIYLRGFESNTKAHDDDMAVTVE